MINNKKEKVFKTFNFFRFFLGLEKPTAYTLRGRRNFLEFFLALFLFRALFGFDNFLNCFFEPDLFSEVANDNRKFLAGLLCESGTFYIPLLFFLDGSKLSVKLVN